jgi:hypothetical protein
MHRTITYTVYAEAQQTLFTSLLNTMSKPAFVRYRLCTLLEDSRLQAEILTGYVLTESKATLPPWGPLVGHK